MASRVRASAIEEIKPCLKAGRYESPGDGTVVVAGRLKAGNHGSAEGLQELKEMVMLGARVRDDQAMPTAMLGNLDENIVPTLSDVDGDENGRI